MCCGLPWIASASIVKNDMTNGSTKPKVLVADDEQVIANTLAIILNQAGFEARAVYSGENATESLETFQPNMLISDVIMTGMTGIEAAARPRRPTCSKRQGRKVTSSRFWRSRCIRLTC